MVKKAFQLDITVPNEARDGRFSTGHYSVAIDFQRLFDWRIQSNS